MEISSKRFVLRDFIEADRPAFIAYHADPRSLALYGQEQAEPDHAEQLLATFAAWATQQPRVNYQFAVIRRHEPNELVGCAGLRCEGFEAGIAELGIELAPASWGRYRYALEIAEALLEFGFRELGLREIIGSTVSANERIARLANWFSAEVKVEQSGASWLAERGWHEVVWRITREAWNKRQAV